MGLLYTGIMNCVFAVLLVGLFARGPVELLLLSNVFVVAAGVFMIIGAVNLRSVQSRGLAQAGAILAILPCTPGFLLSLPFGVWALLVLRQSQVKDAFDRSGSTPEEQLWRPATALVLAAAADCATILFLLLLLRALQSSPARAGEAAVAPGTMLLWAGVFAVGAVGAAMRAAAGVAMLTRRSYAFAIVSSAASVVIFCTPGGLIALPFGIWALLVLRQPDVEEAFRRAKQQSRSRVAQRASDPEEKQRNAELAEIAPGWLGLVASAAVGLGWIVVGAMWNFRVPGLVVGFAVLAAITYATIRLRLVYLPKLRAELARQSAVRRTLALAWGAALFALGMWFVFYALAAFWDLFDNIASQDWMRSLPYNASGKDAIFARFSLDKLASLHQQTATDLFVHGGASGSGSVLPRSMQVISFALLAFLATSCVFGAVHAVNDTRRYRGTWKNHVVVSLNTVLLLMSTLIIVYVVPLFPGFTWAPLPLREMRSSAASGQLETAVDTWARRTGYTVRAERTWQIGKGSNVGIGQVRMLELSALSPFDRRRVAGRFVVRPLPMLKIKCVSVDEPAESYVSVDLPMVTKDSQEESLWPALLDNLEAAIK